MKTSKQLILAFGEAESTCSVEAFPASLTASPGNDSEQPMSATCGPKCLEQLEKLPRVGLWAKTFTGLLVGTGAWYSKRCKLTWRLLGTKYNRTYCRLLVSVRPTSGIGFGLLPTPKATEIEEDYQEWKARQVASGNPKNMGKTTTNIGTMARNGLLPTPQARDERSGSKPEDGRYIRKAEQGWGFNLNDLAVSGMLPTPRARDHKGARTSEALEEAGRNETNSLPDYFSQTGKTSQLNPQFVAEMMGFPPDWLELPFQNTETSPSKPTATP